MWPGTEKAAGARRRDDRPVDMYGTPNCSMHPTVGLRPRLMPALGALRELREKDVCARLGGQLDDATPVLCRRFRLLHQRP